MPVGDKLHCPRCGSTKHRRINSRRFKAKRLADQNVVARAHRCDDCRKEWTTIQTTLLGEMAKAVMEVLDG
jgi:transcriptional regulator NrdR family protein